MTSDAPGPVGGVPAKLPDFQLQNFQAPSAEQLRLVVPRPVQAATAALGFGRQRLALVLSIGTVGAQPVLANAARDALAVATALRSAGFVVMVRDDASGSELRAALQEFRTRLQPGGMGLLYATALGAPVDGRNLLLPREATADAAASAAAVGAELSRQGVPVQELVDALVDAPVNALVDAPAGNTASTRMLVLDAAYQHPALAKLPQSGLLAQPLPPGMMALFAQSPLVVQAVPAVAPLPEPAPSDPQLLAATPFARLLVRAVLTPRLSGAEVLRSTQRAVIDSTRGAVTPWLAGDTDTKEELAELSLLDALLPRTPEEFVREGVQHVASQRARPATGPAGAQTGEQTVAEALQQAPAPHTTTTTATTPPPGPPGGATTPSDHSRKPLPEVPGNASTALGSAANALGAAASVAGTVASVAGTAATVAIGVKAAQAVAAATVANAVASTAVGAVTAVAGQAVALATRQGSSDAGAAAARQAAPLAAAVVPSAPATSAATAATTAATTSATTAARAATGNSAARNLAATAGDVAVAEVLQARNPAPKENLAAPSAPRNEAAAAAEAVSRHTPASQGPDGRTTRNPSGGERPVYQPRSNSHGYAEGDTFSYQVTDTWKGEVTGRYTTAIEEVLDNGQLLANGQQVALDAQGRLKSVRGIDGSLQRFEPHQDLWWSKPTPGQSRDVDFKEIFQRADKTRGETQFKGSSSVGRLQKIETPAGVFEALPIETSGWYHETLASGARSSGKFERTVWYSPQLQHPVAIDIKDVDRLGKLLKRERVELTHAQQVRSAP